MSENDDLQLEEPEFYAPLRAWHQYRARLAALPPDDPYRDEDLWWADFAIRLKASAPQRPTPYVITDELMQKVRQIISLEAVESVSCPFDDIDFWRMLVDEQKKRASISGKGFQQAFTLCGPDSDFHSFDPTELGGNVHIPCEGACRCDLFIIPHWRMDTLVALRTSGEHDAPLLRECRYLLVQRDFGPISQSLRTVIGSWVLYESLNVNNRCDPLALRENAVT